MSHDGCPRLWLCAAERWSTGEKETRERAMTTGAVWCLVVVMMVVVAVLLVAWCCTAAVAVRAKTTGHAHAGYTTYGAKVISSADKHHRRQQRREKRKHGGGCRTVIFGVRCKNNMLLFINTANDPATLRSSRRFVRAALPAFCHRLC
uniref:Uncharacterized protein n=1 Tax=Schizaphis graminum TaxID=13262 RepID=A0A2S2PPD6_SCHGA